MNKIKNIIISFWFKELELNPSSLVFELEDEVKNIINEPLMYNDDNNHLNIAVPRIQGISKDKKYLFTMSYINACLSIKIDDNIENDEIILLINNNIQLFYDIIKRVYNIKIIYSSIKIEMIDEDVKTKDKLINKLGLSKHNYENLFLKRAFVKNNYYINYILEHSSEYNFNFNSNNKLSEADLFSKSLVTSLSDAKIGKEYLLIVVEINDRYSYNVDREYETTKNDLRGMIIELKEILANELYWEL